jgi:hypothetical protein
MNYIKSIGIEIEGGVNKRDLRKIPQDNNKIYIGTDGSVYVEGKDIYNVEIKYWSENLEDVLNFVRFAWRELKIKQNDTCGNHCHIKLVDNALFGIFSYRVFWTAFKKKYVKKFNDEKYLQRLENHYCQGEYRLSYVDKQLQNFSDYRYTMINLHAMFRHGTVEIRIMPYANNLREHLKQIRWVYTTINKLIGKILKRCYLKETTINTIKEEIGNKTINRDTLNQKVEIKKEVLLCA